MAARFIVLSLRGEGPDPFHDGAHGDPAGALGVPRLYLLVPGAARDVQVNPWRILRELLEEHGCGRGSTPPRASCVLDIRDLALDHVSVVISAGKPPKLLSGDTE